MRNVIATGLTLALLAGMVVPAQAFGLGHRRDSCEPCIAPAPPPQISYVEKTITCYKPEWHEKEVQCTVNRLVQRTVIVPQQVTVCVPIWSEKKEVHTVYKKVPHEVVREVTWCRRVRMCMTDPCTGSTYTARVPVTVVKQKKRIVYDCVPEEQECVVKVCTLKKETKTVASRQVVCEVKPEVVLRKVRYCQMVPYQTKIKVPVCVPAGDPPATAPD